MILVAGDIMLDIILLPDLQAAEQGRGVLIRGGGSAANTAAWIAGLGAEATFAGCIGDDPAGQLLQSELRAAGVHTRLRVCKGRESGAVVVEIVEQAERVMRSARGANEELSVADLRRAAGRETSIIHLTGYSLLGPCGPELLAEAGALARRCRALLSFDPSSPTVIERLGRSQLLDAIERCGVSLLLPNHEEARILTGARSALEAANALGERVMMVAVKDGHVGAAFRVGPVNGDLPAEVRPAVDTTGAGDAFNAGVLTALARGEGLPDACLLGVRAAAEAVTIYGGRPARSPLAPAREARI